jgi:cell division septation protein DedD
MRGVFDEQAEEPAQPKRDTELTLGSGTLLAIFFGLVLLCGLCFGLGYTIGHHGPQPPSAASPAANTASQRPQGSSIAKPSATAQAVQTPPTDGAGQASSAASGLTPAVEAQTLPVQVPVAAPSGEPQIRPALTPAVETSQTGQSGGVASSVRPAFAPAVTVPASSLMVQIAAVSNTEDATVLTNALRKRGYPVAARREPADNLIHVRIGPFATPAEANNWRMKLLNDGYNAMVQP